MQGLSLPHWYPPQRSSQGAETQTYKLSILISSFFFAPGQLLAR